MSTPPTRRVRRLDSPTGPQVYLLGTAGEGWVKVQGVKLQITFDTPAERLQPL